jgi:chromosome segregation ATPase
MKEKDIQASADKKYKSEKDQMKNTQKLVEEKEKQVRTLQQQNEEALMAFNKRMEELTEEHRGLRARITELESKCADAESQSQKSLAVSKALGDQLSSASSRCDILTAELEVSRAAQERASNALQEREETIKKVG